MGLRVSPILTAQDAVHCWPRLGSTLELLRTGHTTPEQEETLSRRLLGSFAKVGRKTLSLV